MPFWLKPVSIFGLFSMTMFNSDSHYINHTSQPLLPTDLMLSVIIGSRDLLIILVNKATLSQWLLIPNYSGIRIDRVSTAEGGV